MSITSTSSSENSVQLPKIIIFSTVAPVLTFPSRCYLVDNLANLVTDPDFLLVSTTDAREYERVSLGRKEGDIMKLLVTKHKFFVPNQRVDFQGICSVSPYAPKVRIF